MKTYTSTNDYHSMPETVREHIRKVLNGEQGTFDFLLGGDIFVLETLEELSNITVDFENGGTAVDTVGPMDAAEWIGSGDYAVFFMATNDAGGPCYFTPKWMVDNCIILQSIMRATAGMHLQSAENNGQLELANALRQSLTRV